MITKIQSFDELQHQWQGQITKQIISRSENQDSRLVKRLKIFEIQQLRINLVKTILLVFIIYSFVWYLLKFKSLSVMLLVGLLWIVACLAVFIVYYWKKQFRIDQLNFSLKTSEFIDSVIGKLNNQKKLFKFHFPLLVIGLIIGINILYLEVLAELDLQIRILYHIVGSTFITLFIPLGQKIRKWKFGREQQPVINDLIDFKNEIKE